MTSKVWSIVIICVSLLPSLAAQTQPDASAPASSASKSQRAIDSAKEAHIRRLMQVTHADALVTTMMDNMQGTLRPMLVQSLPPGEYRDKLVDLFLEKFRTKATAAQLIDMAIPHYDKYFTDEELTTLITFYETPVGKKAVLAMPQLTTELQNEGRVWGETAGRESMEEVLAEHPDLKQALEAASLKGKMSQP